MLDRVGSGMRMPVVSRWGIEPQVDEPAHGFFLRLAALNGQVSIRPFAMALDINGRNIKPQEMLNFCEELPIRGLDILRNSTPHLGESVAYVRGERLRNGRDWSIRHRRYCPRCIKESSHHRFWFDLVVSRHCPLHRVELRTDKDGMVWAWGRSEPAPEVEEESIGRTSASFSRYLGGRLRVCDPVKVHYLDRVELDDAIYLCTVVGNVLLYGWRSALPKRVRLEAHQSAAERGFEFLANGGSIEALCEQYLCSTPYLVAGRFTCTDTPKVLGWIHWAKRNKIHERGIAPLRNCIDRLVIEYGACRRLRRKFPASSIERETAAAAARLGLTRAEVVKVASWSPDNEPRSADSQPLDLSVDSIADKARLLCAPKEAAGILGVTTKQLTLLRKSGLINSVFAGTSPSRCWYERQALEEIVARAFSMHTNAQNLCGGLTLDQYRAKAFCSYPETVRLVLEGKATVSGLSGEGCGLSKLRLVSPPAARKSGRTARFIARRKLAPAGYLTLAKAATFISVRPQVVANLARIGALKHRLTSGRISLVTQASVEAFADRYVPVKAVSVQLGCVTATAVRKLRNAGVPIRFDVKRAGACFVERSDVEAVLGMPLQLGDAGAFFEGLKRAILRSDFAHHLEWVPGTSRAILAASSGKARLTVDVDAVSRTVRLALPLAGARRERLLRDRMRSLEEAWPEATIQTSTNDESSFGEVRTLPSSIAVDHNMFSWLEARALVVRTILADRTFPESTCG
jgi:hypothetical protein